jgi:hypothetical protein
MADNPFLVVRVHENTSTPPHTGSWSGQISTQQMLEQITENKDTMLKYERESRKIMEVYTETRRAISYYQTLTQDNERMRRDITQSVARLERFETVQKQMTTELERSLTDANTAAVNL